MQADIVRHVIGHATREEQDLTVLEDTTCKEVSLIQHDRDQSDVVLLSYDQVERLVQWWRESHD